MATLSLKELRHMQELWQIWPQTFELFREMKDKLCKHKKQTNKKEAKANIEEVDSDDEQVDKIQFKSMEKKGQFLDKIKKAKINCKYTINGESLHTSTKIT